MKRLTVVFMVFAFALVVFAGPALAKGNMAPIPGMLVITGPGLKPPMVLRGDVHWNAYGSTGTETPSNVLTAALQNLGLLQAGPEVGWYQLPPDTSTLGPSYLIQEYLDADGKGLTAAPPTSATLYPYAPDRPLVFLQVGLPRSTAHTGLWWSAPPALRAALTSLGLPRTAPATPVSAPLRPVATPSPSPLWMVVFASGALLALIVGAAMAERYRSRVTVSRP
jgi:hypothetical protein